MKKDYCVRSYQEGDEKEIVSLLGLVFDGWPHFNIECTPLEHWRWKYKDNPFKMSFIAVGVNIDQIKSVGHAFPLNIKIGDRVLFCTYAADTVVHPDFRGMGLSKKVIELCVKLRKLCGVQYSYFVTGNPIFIKSFSKTYSRFPYIILNLVRIRDVDLHLQMMPIRNAWLLKLGFHLAKLINYFQKSVTAFKASHKGLHISEIYRFNERIDIFWDSVSNHYDFIVERRRDYLNWRYCDPRAGNFLVRIAEDNEGRVLGYCVLCINKYRRDYPIGVIVDLLTLPGRLDVADVLAGSAVYYFDSQNINIIICQVVDNNPYETIFKKHGFIDSRIKLHLFYKSYIEEDEIGKLKANSASKIHFSYGDIDSLPVSMPSNL